MSDPVLRFPGCGKPNKEISAEGSDFRIVQRWGTAGVPVEEMTEFDPGQPVEGVLDINGEWWVMCRDGSGRSLIVADPFSLQPLYFAAVWTPLGSDLLVGPQLAATAQAMGNIGARVETEWAGVLPALGSRNDFFDTMHDVTTPVRRLLVNLPHQAVLVEEGCYSIIDRPEVKNVSQLSYEEHLRRGAQRAIDEIDRVVQHYTPEKTALNLSGGKDSRLVLALLVAAGKTDTLKINTVDPRTAQQEWRSRILSADLNIASRLVARYGLEWAGAPSPREVWPDTLNGQLFTFQSFRGGRSYAFDPNPHAYRFISPEIRFTGAGAEVAENHMASVWAKSAMWKSLENTPESFNLDAMRILKGLSNTSPVPPEVLTQALNRFVVTMRSISEGGTINDAVAWNYKAFRNRGHVGGMMWSRSMNIVTCNPLLQTDFVRAAKQLPIPARDARRVTFDLIELLLPEMNDLEFQSGPWPWNSGRTTRLDWAAYPADTSDYYSSRSRGQRSKTAVFAPRTRPDMQPLVRSGLEDLEQALTDSGYPGDSLLRGLTRDLPADIRGLGRLLTKLASWAHCMPEAGALSGSADPRAPRIMTMIDGAVP